MTVIERIKVLAENEGSVRKFAEKCGLNERSLNTAIQRNSELKSGTIEQIVSAYPNLNLYWLVLGEGDMFVTDTAEKERLADENGYIKRLNDLLEKRVQLLERELKNHNPDLAREHGIE